MSGADEPAGIAQQSSRARGSRGIAIVALLMCAAGAVAMIVANMLQRGVPAAIWGMMYVSGAAAIALGIGIWRLRAWALRLAIALGILVFAAGCFSLVRDDVAFERLVIGLPALLAVASATLFLLHPSTRSRFGRA